MELYIELLVGTDNCCQNIQIIFNISQHFYFVSPFLSGESIFLLWLREWKSFITFGTQTATDINLWFRIKRGRWWRPCQRNGKHHWIIQPNIHQTSTQTNNIKHQINHQTDNQTIHKVKHFPNLKTNYKSTSPSMNEIYVPRSTKPEPTKDLS